MTFAFCTGSVIDYGSVCSYRFSHILTEYKAHLTDYLSVLFYVKMMSGLFGLIFFKLYDIALSAFDYVILTFLLSKIQVPRLFIIHFEIAWGYIVHVRSVFTVI